MFKFLKKSSAVVLSFVMVISTITGCSGKNNSASGSQSGSTSQAASGNASGNKIKLTFMDWESADMNKLIMGTMDDFMSKNPNITVDLIPSPLSDYSTKLQQMLAANQAPDVFMVGSDFCFTLGYNGYLLDISKNTSADSSFVKNFYPGTIEAFSDNGKQYALPGLINVLGVFYNKPLFDKAGLSYPEEGWTYDEMFKDAEKLKNTATKTYGLYDAQSTVDYLGLYSVQNGGKYFSDADYNIKTVQADDKFKEGIKTFSDHVKDGSITPFGYDDSNVVAQFMAGSVPMMQYGQWAADEIIRNAPSTLKWGYVSYPVGPSKDDSSYFGATGWGVNAASKNQDAAYTLCKYIVSSTYESVLPKTSVAPAAYMPSSKPYFQALKDKGHTDMATGVDAMCNAGKKYYTQFSASYIDKAKAFINADWPNIINGKADVSQVDKMVSDINGVIK